MEFVKPTIEYADLWPLILVFGVACAGVLVEAFLPRRVRYVVQTGLALAGLVVAVVGVGFVAANSEVLGDGAARGLIAAEGTIAVDGPTLFLWGLILLLAIGGVLLFAERHLEGGVSAFAGQAAALPGSEAERTASTSGLDHTEVYPLLMFSVGGMMLFPAANDLLTMFVALEVFSLPLYLLCGLARRRRLLSQEAALKYFLLGAFSSGFFLYGMALTYGFAGSMEFGAINEAVRNDLGNRSLLLIGMGMLAVGLFFKIGAVPFQAWTPDAYQGAPTAVTAFMAAATKVAAIGALLRLFYVAFGADRWTWQPMMWVIAILTMAVGAALAVVQSDMKRMLAYSSVAHTGFLLTGVLGVQTATDLSDGQLTSLQAVLFYLVTYGFAVLGRVRGRDAGPRRRWRADTPLPLGRARQGVPAGGRRLRVLPARDGRHPADVRLRRQVGRLRGRPVRRRLSGRDRRHPVQHRRRVLLRARDRADVLLGARGRDRAQRHAPVDPHRGHDRGGRRGHARPGRHARPRARSRGECWTIPQVTLSEPLAMPVTDPALAERLRERMAVVEKALSGHVRSRAGFVTEAASHLMEAGGKRFRPLLVLLAAECGERPDSDDVITAACVVELTHLASLYHDDVMDEADLRRGAESANARWDNHVAILTGDFLFSKSSELTAELGPDAVRIQAQTFTQLVEGQILETVQPRPDEDPLAHYLDVVAGKTGSLIATSARYGARFGGATREVEEALTAYGEIVGSAFQLSDDILDIASETDESGKTPGTDLREGVPTLPVLMARAAAAPGDARLLELLDGDLTDDARHAEALDLLRKHPAIDEARAYVVARAQEAKALLVALPEGPVREALEAFADIVATRSA